MANSGESFMPLLCLHHGVTTYNDICKILHIRTQSSNKVTDRVILYIIVCRGA